MAGAHSSRSIPGRGGPSFLAVFPCLSRVFPSFGPAVVTGRKEKRGGEPDFSPKGLEFGTASEGARHGGELGSEDTAFTQRYWAADGLPSTRNHVLRAFANQGCGARFPRPFVSPNRRRQGSWGNVDSFFYGLTFEGAGKPGAETLADEVPAVFSWGNLGPDKKPSAIEKRGREQRANFFATLGGGCGP